MDSKPRIFVFPEFGNPELLQELYRYLSSEVDFENREHSIIMNNSKSETPAIQEIYRTNLKLFYPQDYDEDDLEDIVQKILDYDFVIVKRLSDRIIFKLLSK